MANSERDSNMTITDEDFLKFREFFYRKTGIFLEESKRYYVDKRLVERIVATDCDNFREYFMLVRFQASGMEMQNLINIMTVNETYFFRESYQFDCLVQHLLAERVRHKSASESIKIWSLPCSTGEEIYSIAIYLLENWPLIDRYDVELIGSDIDTNVLDTALEGVYAKRSLHALPPHLVNKYFKRRSDSTYQISSDLRDAVEFLSTNIIAPSEMRRFRNFDVIFCRNMLIYFDDYSRRLAAEAIYDALSPGGFICLGHSESMSRISELFKIRKFPDAIVYQKPF